jgi:hypothetical protein
MITIVPALDSDFRVLTRNMRPADYAEVLAQLGAVDPRAMWESVAGTDVKAAFDGGSLVAVFGCYPHPSQEGVGIPWMLGTTLLDTHAVTLCRLCRPVVDDWQRRYTYLTNLASLENRKVLKWLRWLGFKFAGTYPGQHDPSVTFVQFIRVSHHV